MNQIWNIPRCFTDVAPGHHFQHNAWCMMKMISALLNLCEGTHQSPCEFSSQRPVMCYVFHSVTVDSLSSRMFPAKFKNQKLKLFWTFTAAVQYGWSRFGRNINVEYNPCMSNSINFFYQIFILCQLVIHAVINHWCLQQLYCRCGTIPLQGWF